ncbi:MAG: hypothetical protein Q4P16_09335 [Spirochaetales bacterium]|nr:hypothetical protein [Spirochaetales bacterium]
MENDTVLLNHEYVELCFINKKVIGQNSSFATTGQLGKSHCFASSAGWSKNAEML